MGGMGRGMGGPGGGGPGGPGVLLSDVLTPAAAFLEHLGLDARVRPERRQDARAGGDREGQDRGRPDHRDRRGPEDEPRQREGGRLDHGRPGDEPARPATPRQVTELVNNGPPVPPGGKAGRRPAEDRLRLPRHLGLRSPDGAEGRQDARRRGDAAGNGKTVAGLVTALEAPAKTKLDTAVTNNDITQAQETAILANMTTHLTNMINGVKPDNSAGTSTASLNGVRTSLARFTTVRVLALRHR